MEFNDPIYGTFTLPSNIQRAIAHPAFQRLYHIAQLGLAMYSPGFEGLRHTRAEHSIGTAYLAGVIGNYLHISSEDCEIIQMAGLLHDEGQGPTSHSFEKVVVARHEERSQEIARLVLQEIYDPVKISTVCYLIDPVGTPPTPLAGILRDIVSNKTCALDVDKLDYGLRDSYYTGEYRYSIGDVFHLIYSSRIITDSHGFGTWYFDPKTEPIIRSVFEHRQHLFKTVYRTENNLRLEAQMVRAARQLSTNFSDLDTFLKYTDQNFMHAISQTSEGQQLLLGNCPLPEPVDNSVDQQAPELILPKVPYYT